MTLDEIIQQTLDYTDKFEFTATKSKAKNAEKQTIRVMKQLRDFLNASDLDAFKVK
jgi:hypothetical protein